MKTYLGVEWQSREVVNPLICGQNGLLGLSVLLNTASLLLCMGDKRVEIPLMDGVDDVEYEGAIRFLLIEVAIREVHVKLVTRIDH